MKPLKKLQNLSESVRAIPSLEESCETQGFSEILESDWFDAEKKLLEFGSGLPQVSRKDKRGVFLKVFLSDVEVYINLYIRTDNSDKILNKYLEKVTYVA